LVSDPVATRAFKSFELCEPLSALSTLPGGAPLAHANHDESVEVVVLGFENAALFHVSADIAR
jgi:hypothetical protein